MNRATLSRTIGFLLLAGVVLALDQGTKTLVTDRLMVGESWSPVPSLSAIFQITRSMNSGAAFSIFQGANGPLLLLSLVMSAGIIYFFFHTPADQRLQRIALGILLGGVLGNALDRIRIGTVVDFIHWQIPGVVSNVSNLADHAIVLSVILLLLAQRGTTRYDADHEQATQPPADRVPDRPADSVRNRNSGSEPR